MVLEMLAGAVDVVGVEGAADAALFPAGAEHEVLDDQLAAPLEKVGEGYLAPRPVEDIGLLDLDPGHLAALPAQFVARPGKLLLLRQQRPARDQPFVLRHDVRMVHAALLCLGLRRTRLRLPERSRSGLASYPCPDAAEPESPGDRVSADRHTTYLSSLSR